MAQSENQNRIETQSDSRSDVARRDEQRMARPSSAFERFADEMDRMFDDFGSGRNRWLSRQRGWTPAVEVYQRDHDLVVRAELPGIRKEDVKIELTDDAIVIEGSRRHEEKKEQGGVYRSEWSYGSFYRTIPLPEGAMTDQAKATFNDGVLEIRMSAPPEQTSRGRRLEIQDVASASKPAASKK